MVPNDGNEDLDYPEHQSFQKRMEEQEESQLSTSYLEANDRIENNTTKPAFQKITRKKSSENNQQRKSMFPIREKRHQSSVNAFK